MNANTVLEDGEPYATYLKTKTDVYSVGVYPQRHLPGKGNIEKEIEKFNF